MAIAMAMAMAYFSICRESSGSLAVAVFAPLLRRTSTPSTTPLSSTGSDWDRAPELMAWAAVTATPSINNIGIYIYIYSDIYIDIYVGIILAFMLIYFVIFSAGKKDDVSIV